MGFTAISSTFPLTYQLFWIIIDLSTISVSEKGGILWNSLSAPIKRYAASRMEQPELTQSELQLLRHVGFHGEVSQRHLADEMGVDKAMISRILQKLEAKGYLVRTEDENDARSKNVRALPPALEIHSQGKGLSEQFFDQVTGDFSTEERELLDQLLGRMLEKGKALAAAPAPEKEVRP